MKQSSWNLQDKKALITGGSRGIGRAIVEEFLQLGAEIFIVSKNKNNFALCASNSETRSKIYRNRIY